MKKFSCFVYGLIIGWGLLAGVALADDPKPDIEIKLMNPEITEVKPGNVVTMSFLIMNHSQTQGVFFEQLGLPENWQLLIPTASFTLEPDGQEVRLLTVVIPATCLAGTYPINYSIISQGAQQNTYTSSVNLKVASVTGIKSLIEAKPPVVIAGESYTLKLRYINSGNSPLTITFNVNTAPAYPVKSSPAEISLAPNESQVFTMDIQTDSKLASNMSQTINIKAVDKDSSNILCDDTILIDIIPKITGTSGLYHRIPGQIKVIAGFDETNSVKPNPDLQFDFSMSGSIDDSQKNLIDLHLLTPNVAGETLGQNQEYFQFNYSNEFLQSSIGNQSAVLSPLTRRWDDSYKINVNLDIQKSFFGIIWPENKADYPRQNELGLYYGYQLSPSLYLRANLLNWSAGTPINSIYSLQSELKLAPDTSLNLEYGFGNSDNTFDNSSAYRINLNKQSSNSLNYSLESIYAAPNFPGNYSDLSSTSGSASISLDAQTQSSFAFRIYRNNLEINPARNSAYQDFSYNVNFSHVLNSQVLLVASLENLQEQNLLPDPGSFTEEKFVKFGLQYQLARWKLVPSLAIGSYDDILAATMNYPLILSSLTVNYTPNPDQSFLLYANIGNSNYTSLPNTNNMIGVSTSIHFKNNFNLNLEYQKNSNSDSDCFIFNLSYHRTPYFYRVSSSQLSNSGANDYNGALMATYTLPFWAPISKRTDLGTLKGKVYDAEQPGNPGIANVILRLNGISVATNQDGEFCIASLPPGVYPIVIDKSLIGLNLAPMEKLPLLVEVKKGETKYVSIGMARAGRITGKIVILTADDAQNSGNLVVDSDKLFTLQGDGQSNSNLSSGEFKEAQALTNVIVELTDGAETFHQVTGANGYFSFEGIRSGKWKLRVYDNNLPPHYYFEQEELEIDLKPNEEQEIVFKAIPQIRSIQIIDEGKI